MVGSGRSFNEPGFLDKLRDLKGYILADVETFPDVPFYIVLSEEVRVWWLARHLGTTTKVSRDKVLRLLATLP